MTSQNFVPHDQHWTMKIKGSPNSSLNSLPIGHTHPYMPLQQRMPFRDFPRKPFQVYYDLIIFTGVWNPNHLRFWSKTPHCRSSSIVGGHCKTIHQQQPVLTAYKRVCRNVQGMKHIWWIYGTLRCISYWKHRGYIYYVILRFKGNRYRYSIRPFQTLESMSCSSDVSQKPTWGRWTNSLLAMTIWRRPLCGSGTGPAREVWLSHHQTLNKSAPFCLLFAPPKSSDCRLTMCR